MVVKLVKKLFVLLILSVFITGCASSTSAGGAMMSAPGEVVGSRGMVAASMLAEQAGLKILQAGGNAVDAAVAVGLALNVAEPYTSGIGGGGFMVVRFADTGEVVAIDFRERAPAAAFKEMYAERERADKNSGPLSVGVPGTLMGYEKALQMYGTMSFAEVIQPAIEMAENGVPVSSYLADTVTSNYEKLEMFNDLADVPYIVDGVPMQEGEIVRLPQMAAMFRMIADMGAAAFYNGPLGETFVNRIQQLGNEMGMGDIMTMQDLADYSAEIRQPMSGTYRGYNIYAMSPPSSGGLTLVEILNMLENYNVGDWGFASVEHVHYMTEIMRLAYSDRAAYMADPDFVDIPYDALLSKEHAKERIGHINADKAMPAIPYSMVQVDGGNRLAMADEHPETTHFTVADIDGNIVAVTQTINYYLGSKVIDPEYGYFYNNELDDFSADPTSVNAPEPGKRPLSSMTPTIITNSDGTPFMALGSPGGSRIIGTVAHTIVNMIDFGMGLDEAIEAPRFWTGVSGDQPWALSMEEDNPYFTTELQEKLAAMGHEVSMRGVSGCTNAVLYKDNMLIGAGDSRRDGVAAGY